MSGRLRPTRVQQWEMGGGSPVSYPQSPEGVQSCCMLLPDELCKTLSVQFVGDDPGVVRNDPSLK
eukprot:14124739-Alexandrium_andersonii.AAC.1